MQSHFMRPARRVPKDPSEPLADLVVSKNDFDRFKASLFELDSYHDGLGVRTAIAVVFDLEGFTTFASTPDPHLSVPQFIDQFITWFFDTLGEFLREHTETDEVYLHAPPPFYAKFLGDGLLLLWEVDYQGAAAYCRQSSKDKESQTREIQGDIGNLISILRSLCLDYSKTFVTKAKKYFTDVPRRLRCGIAQGLVCELGNGIDYVGPCINMAARLQKAAGLGIAVRKSGIDLDLSQSHELAKSMVLKKYMIRGQGEELIYVFKADFDVLSDQDKSQFQDVC